MIVITISGQDKQRRAECQEEDWEDDEEGQNVCDSLHYKLDVERSGIKYSEPVEHFGPYD